MSPSDLTTNYSDNHWVILLVIIPTIPTMSVIIIRSIVIIAPKIASGGAPAPLGGAAGGSPPPAPWKLALQPFGNNKGPTCGYGFHGDFMGDINGLHWFIYVYMEVS